jgi:hypothetical protein
MVIDDFAEILEDLGVELVVVDDKEGNEADLEILVGTVTSRGEDYEYDKYSLGFEGYAIKAIDETKVLVTGGSDMSLASAFKKFFEEFLLITDDIDELEDVTIYEEDWLEKPQDDYRITSIKVGKTDLKGYTIARDKSYETHAEAAIQLQDFFYKKAGYYLPIVDLSKASDKSIVFSAVSKGKAGENGFQARVDGETLYIECAHDNKFTEAFKEYYNTNFISARNDVELKKFTPEVDISIVTYAECGAVGDGKTDDSEAIRSAHRKANIGGQTVIGEGLEGDTFYIGEMKEPISVKTDTDWKGATFIFDDTKLDSTNSCNVFSIESDYGRESFNTSNEYIIALNANKDEKTGLVIKGINHGEDRTKKLDLGLGYPALLIVNNENHNAYIRWGYVDSAGSKQREVVLIDENGNIDPDTPFLLDYEEVTFIQAIRADVTPITVKNAKVISKASHVNLFVDGYKSIARGITISRPNTTIKGIEHIIEGEYDNYEAVVLNKQTGVWDSVKDQGFTVSVSGKTETVKLNGGTFKGNDQYKPEDIRAFVGHSYSGIVQVDATTNIHIEDTIFQARVKYREGTYDISATLANEIIFEGCTQNNFFDEDPKYGGIFPNMARCWGIAGTNYCKNMDYIDCMLTRYDAHAGVYNGEIINSTICILRLIGGGTFRVEDTTVYSKDHAPFQLRSDYGSTFNGTLILKNLNILDGRRIQQGKATYITALVDAPSANWDFGYQTHFPELVIDNVNIETELDEIAIVNIADGDANSTESYANRSLVRQDVHDPDAKFTYRFTTAFEWDPDTREYVLDENGEKISLGTTKTHIIKNAENVNPYTPPETIEILNMKNKDFKLTLFKCDFFNSTTIKDEDGALKRVSVPKK